tara:strand:+ start:268 stop:483 length:216 start_codon:yes stop_codon:yes gene_type:complete
MTRQELIEELQKGILQLQSMGDLEKEVKVVHSICTGGYSEDHREIDQLGIEFNNEEGGDVVVMDYGVCEIE